MQSKAGLVEVIITYVHTYRRGRRRAGSLMGHAGYIQDQDQDRRYLSDRRCLYLAGRLITISHM